MNNRLKRIIRPAVRVIGYAGRGILTIVQVAGLIVAGLGAFVAITTQLSIDAIAGAMKT